MHSNRRDANKNQHGFTLIEIIISIVATSILMVAVWGVLGKQVARGTDPLNSVRATELGQAYLEEILGKRFAENSPLGNTLRCRQAGGPGPCTTPLGPDSGETKHQTFDDVDDYNGFTESPPTDQNGIARNGYAGFTVSVVVAYAGAQIGLNNLDAKRIDVTITEPAPRTTQYRFSVYKTNF